MPVAVLDAALRGGLSPTHSPSLWARAVWEANRMGAIIYFEDVMSFQVELRNIDGSTTAIGTAGPHALVVDRPVEAGGGGHGFNGGELLHLAVAGCISNDLFREASLRGIHLTRIVVRVDGHYEGDPAISTGISYSVELYGNAPEPELQALIDHVDAIAEIPNSLRNATEVRLSGARINVGTQS